MLFKPRWARTLIPSLLQNPFLFLAAPRPRSRRAAAHRLYLEILEERTLLSVTVSDINLDAHHNSDLAIALADFTAAFSAPDSLDRIMINALPTHGTLSFNGSPATTNAISIVDFVNLTYTPDANYSGADVISWNGADTTSFADTPAHINITVQESAPTLGDVSKLFALNTSIPFLASDFNAGFSDADSGDNHNLQTLQIVSLPTHGTLTLGGDAVSQNQSFAITQIANLTYLPAVDYAGSDAFSWNASDGTDFATTSANVNLTIIQKPVVSQVGEIAQHHTPLHISLVDFSAAFVTTTGTLDNLEFPSLPAHGSLTLNGSAVAVDQIIPISDLPNLTYLPDANYSGNDTFTWNGAVGTVFANAPAPLSVTIFDNAPTTGAVSRTVGKNVATAFTLADFSGSFSDSDSGDTLQAIKIASLPSAGRLMLNGLPVAFNQVITSSQIPSLTYTPNASATSDTFSWMSSDGSLFSTASAPVNLTINNSAPTLSNISLSTAHNTSKTLGAASFTSAFADPDPGDQLTEVVLSLPTYGTLSLAGVPIYNSQPIPLSKLGKLTYKPNPGFAGTDTFFWNASDGTQNASSSAEIAIHVDGLAPSVAPVAKGVLQNASAMAFDSWDFTNSFTEPNAGPILQSITVLSLPTHGTLTLSGSNVTAGQVITATHIADLSYRPASGFVGADSFKWKASDGTRASGSSTVNLKVVSASALTVSGHGAVIPTGSTRTSTVDFTNFGPLSGVANIDHHADTRTFTITNNSTASINFTGGAHLVQITGNNPKDFSASTLTDSLSHASISALAPGHSANFTITFFPTRTGTRSATVRIPVSSGNAFTFHVSGTGLFTLDNNFSGSTTFGLQYATLKAGTGPGAGDGNVLSMNYTGYLFDGTRFDSSLNPGRTPFQFQLGASPAQVIKGWDPGLLGIKLGEIRVLILPFSLAYGTSGSGSIPPNATLIFIVQCVGIGLPRLGLAVNGNTHNITPKSSPSLFEGTVLPMMTATQTSLTTTFNIFDVGYQDASGSLTSALFFTGANASSSVVLAGNDAANFVLNYTGGSSFTVTFNRPDSISARTATLTVLTNDPVFPSFTFTIQASSGNIDLTPVLAPTNFPVDTINAGDQTDLAIPVIVRNIGDAPSTGNSDIRIFVVDSAGTQTTLTTLANQNLAGIAGHSSKSLTLHAAFPIGFLAGTYNLGLTLNPSHTLVETNYTNNSATTTQSVTVTQDFADIVGRLVSDTLPPSIISNASLGGSVSLWVANQSNFPLPTNQQVTIQILAHNTATSQDIVLATSSALSVASLPPNDIAKFTLPVRYTNGIPAGDYDIQARILPVQDLPEKNTANNLATQGTNAQHLTFTSIAAFVDFSATLGATNFPSTTITSGDRTTFSLPLTITNFGNIPSTGSATITLFALNTSTQDQITLATLANQNFAGIAPNHSRTMTLSTTLPFGMTSGTYQLGVSLNPAHTLAESTFTNNSATSTQTINVTQGLPDLTGAILSSTVPSSILGNRPINATIVVSVANDGNILLPANQQITLKVIAHNIGLNQDTTLATTSALSVASLAAGASKTFTIPVAFQAGILPGNYWFRVQITPVQSLLENNTANNLLTPNATDQVFAAAPVYDLAPTLGTVDLPAVTITSGDRTTLTLPITVTNLGNITTTGNSDITLFALNSAGEQTSITTLANQNLGGIAPDASRTMTLSTTLPIGFSTGTYQLGIALNPSHTLAESTFTNNSVTTTQTIDVVQGLPDLTGALVSTTIPANIIGGQPLTSNLVVSVSNAGNVLLPADQQITITVLAHNANASANTTLTTSSALSVASLASGASLTFTVPISFSAGLTAGTYTLRAQITPVQSLLENTTANNLITTTNATDTQLTVTVAAPFYDLSPTLGTTTLPAATVISGDGTTLTLPVIITNNGNISSTGNSDITVFAFNTNTSTQTTITTLTAQNLGGIAPNASRTLSLTTTLPVGFSTGTYELGVSLNPSHTLAESTFTNNSVTTTQTIDVTRGFYDLSGTLVSSTLKPAVVYFNPLSGSLVVTVTNSGNLILPSNQTITLAAIAHGTATGIDRILDTSTVSVASLHPGVSKTFTLTIAYNPGLPADTFLLEAQITPVQTLAENSTANNLITTNASGQNITLISDVAFYDFTAAFRTTSFPATTITSGDRTTLSLPITVSNFGNVPSAGSSDITIFALNTSTQVQTTVATLTNQNLGGINPGQSKTMTLTTSLPIGFPAGTYQLGVTLNPSQDLFEHNYTNNSATATQTISVALGLADLTGNLVSTSFPHSLIGGTTTNSNLVVTVANHGTVLLPANQQITFTVLAHNTSTAEDSALAISAPFSVASLAVNATKSFTIPLNLAANLPAGNYTLEAHINPVQPLDESDTANNLLSPNASDPSFNVTVIAPVYDLSPTFGTINLPATTITSGDGTSLSLPITVTNSGNVASTGNSDITIFALNTAGDQTSITTLANQNLGGIAPNTSRTMTLSTTLPYGFSSGTYQLGVALNPSHALTETTYTNNSVTTTQTITVLQGLPDLSGALVSTTVPAHLVASAAISSNLVVSVSNAGNVLLPANQQITLTVLAHNTNNSANITLATTSALSVASLASGASLSFTVPISFSAGLTVGTYTLQARITPVQSLLENSTANNLITANASDQSLSVTVAAPAYDLSPTLGTTNLPAANFTSGDGTILTLPVIITNNGNITSTGNSDIAVFAFNTNTSAQTAIATLTAQNLGGIAPNTSRTLTLNTTLPYGFSSGTYELGVTLNPSHALTESSYTNNSVTTTQTIDVTQGLPDLSGALVSTSLNPAVVYFNSLVGNLVVTVANSGNVVLPANQFVTVDAIAHGIVSGQNIALASTVVSVVSFHAGDSITVTLPFTYDPGFPQDTFLLEARLTPSPALPENSTSNNLITTNASGQNLSVLSTTTFVDLTGTFASTLPASLAANASLGGAINVSVANLGNVSLPSNQQITLTVIAHNTDTSADFTLATSSPLSVASLAANATKSLAVNVNNTAGLAAGNYIIETRITPVQTLTESNTANNLLTLTAAAAPVPLTVT